MTGRNPARIEADYLLETAYPLRGCCGGDRRRAVERYVRPGFPARRRTEGRGPRRGSRVPDHHGEAR